MIHWETCPAACSYCSFPKIYGWSFGRKFPNVISNIHTHFPHYWKFVPLAQVCPLFCIWFRNIHAGYKSLGCPIKIITQIKSVWSIKHDFNWWNLMLWVIDHCTFLKGIKQYEKKNSWRKLKKCKALPLDKQWSVCTFVRCLADTRIVWPLS